MGPYCNFCNNRCFVRLPDLSQLPEDIQNAYKAYPVDIIATCQAGQAFEKHRTGYCYNDIKAAQARLLPVTE